MVRMSIVPVRHGHGTRTRLPDEPHDVELLCSPPVDAPVRPSEVEAPLRTQHRAGRFTFGLAFLGRTVRAQLAAREIAEPDAPALSRVKRNGPAEPDLDVVGMRAEYEQVDLCRRCHSDR